MILVPCTKVTRALGVSDSLLLLHQYPQKDLQALRNKAFAGQAPSTLPNYMCDDRLKQQSGLRGHAAPASSVPLSNHAPSWCLVMAAAGTQHPRSCAEVQHAAATQPSAWHPVLPWDWVQSTSLRPSPHMPHSFAPMAVPGDFGHAMIFLPHKRVHRARCSALGSSAGLGEMAAGPRVWSFQQLTQRVSGVVMRKG